MLSPLKGEAVQEQDIELLKKYFGLQGNKDSLVAYETRDMRQQERGVISYVMDGTLRMDFPGYHKMFIFPQAFLEGTLRLEEETLAKLKIFFSMHQGKTKK